MKLRSSLILSTALVSTLYAAGVYAQQTPPPPPAGESAGLEEIMVTATRRTTNLQSTPVAVSAVDATLINQVAPHDLGDLAAFVPNFSASRITGFNAASFALRGVGVNNIIVYFEAPVAVLVDDFVMPSVQTQLLDTFDVDQVEVLRGPQGTLFGKNTTGGAITVHTTKPDLENFGGKVRASYGSYNEYRLNAAINVPLVKDKLALRLVGGYEKGDGYMRNGAHYGPVTSFVPTKWSGRVGAGDGARVGGPDIFNARAKLLFKPTENIKALLQYEIVRDRSASPATVNTTPNNARFSFAALGLAGGTGDPIMNGGVSNRNGLLVDIQKGHRIDVDGLYLNIDADVDGGTFTSVTGYRNQRSRLANTYPGTAPVATDGEINSLFDANRSDNRKTFQQEVRFASKFTGPLNFVAGGFYQHEKIDFCVSQLLGFLDLFGVAGPPGGFNNNPFLLCNNQRGESIAGFGEATYKATEQLTLTAGFRYTYEKKTWQGRQQVFPQQLTGGWDPTLTWQTMGDLMNAADFGKYPAGVVTVPQSWKSPNWRFSVGYQATPDVYTYFTYSRGFKGGGFNDQIGGFAPFGSDLASFATAARATNPEKADSFEIGVKTESFEKRLRLNVTGFFVQYKDVQKQIVVPVGVNQVTMFFNAAKMEVKGVEAELTALPTEGLMLRALLGYQDSKYKKYVTLIPAGYDLSTADTDRSPKWQWTLDANYEVPLNTLGKVAFNGSVNYVGKNLFTQSIVSPLDNTYLEARTLVNASVTFSDPTDNYYLRFLGQNLTDKRYKTAEQVVTGLWSFALYGPPRTFAAEIGAKF